MTGTPIIFFSSIAGEHFLSGAYAPREGRRQREVPVVKRFVLSVEVTGGTGGCSELREHTRKEVTSTRRRGRGSRRQKSGRRGDLSD